jgi:aryl-alcohol dehydrogenase-like predicted oxidoreductase
MRNHDSDSTGDSVQTSTLGRSGLLVSAAALGTMNFGTDPRAPTPEAEAHRIIGAFLDAGHNLIDTADTYRGGASEELVGRANYSVLARAIETEILPTCSQHGLGVLAYSPLGSGLLAGRYRRDTAPEPGSRLAQWADMPNPMARGFVTGLLAPRHFDIADEVATVAAELHTAATTVALAWLTRQPMITSVILGPRTAGQLTAGLAGLAFELPEQTATRLNAASQFTVVPLTNGQHHAA